MGSDQALFETVVQALQARLYNCWRPDLLPGKLTATQLQDVIALHDACVFVATKTSVASEWCKAEVAAFWGRFKLVVVYLTEESLKKNLPPQFQGAFFARTIPEVIRALDAEWKRAMGSIQTKRCRQDLAPLLAAISEIQPSLGFDWLFHGDDILRFEGFSPIERVLVVTPHLRNDTDDYEQADQLSTVATLTDNLRRGVAYTYVVPSSDEIDQRLDTLKTRLGEEINRVRIVKCSRKLFSTIPTATDLAFYDLREPADSRMRAFQELNCHRVHTYWIELAFEAALTLRAIVNNIILRSIR